MREKNMVHNFYIVNKESVEGLTSEEACRYICSHKEQLPRFDLPDHVMLRNIGRIDGVEWFSTRDFYIEGKMKLFSCFMNGFHEDVDVGIDYYGLTLIDTDSIKHLLEYDTALDYRDYFSIMRFKTFCRKALLQGKWILHWGI